MLRNLKLWSDCLVPSAIQTHVERSSRTVVFEGGDGQGTIFMPTQVPAALHAPRRSPKAAATSFSG